MSEAPACCEEIKEGLIAGFIIARDGSAYLADRTSADAIGQSGEGVQSVLYGPVVTFCPFCGSKLPSAEEG